MRRPCTETWLYGYNHLNQLTQIQHKTTSAGSVDEQVDFTYDVFGNRVERNYDADGAGVGSATVEKFAYDLIRNAWADLDSGGSLTTRRLYERAIDALFARIDSGGADWYLTDRLGSVRDIMNNSSSSIYHADFDGYGNIINEINPSNGDRYKYTSREWEAEFNLQYNRARYYDPSIGRWISQDPIGFNAGDSNLYRYVNNRPTMAVDPSGLFENQILTQPEKPSGWNPIKFPSETELILNPIKIKNNTILIGKPNFMPFPSNYDWNDAGKIIKYFNETGKTIQIPVYIITEKGNWFTETTGIPTQTRGVAIINPIYSSKNKYIVTTSFGKDPNQPALFLKTEYIEKKIGFQGLVDYSSIGFPNNYTQSGFSKDNFYINQIVKWTFGNAFTGFDSKSKQLSSGLITEFVLFETNIKVIGGLSYGGKIKNPFAKIIFSGENGYIGFGVGKTVESVDSLITDDSTIPRKEYNIGEVRIFMGIKY